MKEIQFNTEARQTLLNGINTLTNAVKITLGPRGKNVIIARDNSLAITKDGVTVAREVHLPNYMEDIGSQILKQVANKVVLEVGDGTTTATVLAHSIFSQGNTYVNNGSKPGDLKKGIEEGTKQIIKNLEKQVVQVSTIDEIRGVATISANNDSELGNIIADAIDKVGFDGLITVGESKTGNTYIELVEGMKFNSGYISPYFVTNSDKNIIELINPYVLIYDSKINNIKELMKLLEFAKSKNRPILIICDSIDNETLTTLIVNNLRHTIDVAIVKAPGFGTNKLDQLLDISIITGGQVISNTTGKTLGDSNSQTYLGSCKKVVITANDTTIIDGDGENTIINEYTNSLKTKIANCDNPSEKLILQERLSKFEGGVAIIKLGATSEMEAREKGDRLEDALGATRAAIEEGIIPGGGIALIRAANELTLTSLNEDFVNGLSIIRNACLSPFATILENANIDPKTILPILLDSTDYSYGFDVKNEEFGNLFELGIVDPLKVTRVALENAISIANLLITSDCLMVKPPTE